MDCYPRPPRLRLLKCPASCCARAKPSIAAPAARRSGLSGIATVSPAICGTYSQGRPGGDCVTCSHAGGLSGDRQRHAAASTVLGSACDQSARRGGQTSLFSRRRCVRVVRNITLCRDRGRREGRAPAGTHGPRATKSTRQNHRSADVRPSLRGDLTTASRSPWCAGLFGHHHPRDAGKRHRKLDTSVGVSGPHDLAVRIEAVRRHDQITLQPDTPTASPPRVS